MSDSAPQIVLEPTLPVAEIVLVDSLGNTATLGGYGTAPSDAVTVALQTALRGQAGPPGSSASQFLFTQSVPEAVWVIAHGLGGYPTVVVIDSAGSVVEGDVEYDSTEQVTLTFSAGFAGTARLI